jgi:hypothetical protein
MVINQWGESYRVCCPFCSDTRHRLHISHRWARTDQENNDDNLHLCRCFNENCLSTRERQKELHAMVFPGGVWAAQGIGDSDLPPVKPDIPKPPVQITMPIGGVPVNQLPSDHPARLYLESRGFSVDRLGIIYGVVYVEFCYSSDPELCDPRIVIPIIEPVWGVRKVDAGVVCGERGKTKTITKNVIYMSGTHLAGWQARLPYDPVPKYRPKYLSATGMRKTHLLYGLSRALTTTGPAVIVEGIFDAWKLGDRAMAVFGKTLSIEQLGLIIKHFPGRPIIVMLDCDALENAQKIRDQIQQRRIAVGDTAAVAIAQMPPGRKDPGESTDAELKAAIDAAINTAAR